MIDDSSSPPGISPRTARALARGIVLYNGGQFWEAHEAWEEGWMEEEGQTRLFLQGLIQVAAGYYKATVQRQPRGCVKLLKSGLDKLGTMPEGMGGLALRRFVAQVERTLSEATRWLSGEGRGLPREMIPRIELL